MKHENGWYTDENNNRWDDDVWTEEQAERFSKTLINCSDCSDCSDCRGCRGCSDCRDCSDCSNCSYCSDCRDCSNCRGCSDCRGCRDCSCCSNCSDCSDCRGCRDCSCCRGCSNCSYCSDCRDCSNCRGCSSNPQRIVSDLIGSRSKSTTVYLSDNKYQVICGCFNGDLKEFENAVNATHGDNEHGKAYKAFIKKVKIYFEVEE